MAPQAESIWRSPQPGCGEGTERVRRGYGEATSAPLIASHDILSGEVASREMASPLIPSHEMASPLIPSHEMASPQMLVQVAARRGVGAAR